VIEVAPGQSRTVGRGGQADITIDDPSLSRIHARVTAELDGLLAVDDLGSTNGVLVNGREQLSSYLRAGDIVLFGRVEYVVGKG
jgi:pSer/pThr/pTyr-binding forkhead associated (FHA) protein